MHRKLSSWVDRKSRAQVAKGPPWVWSELTKGGGPVPGMVRVSAPPGMSVSTARGTDVRQWGDAGRGRLTLFLPGAKWQGGGRKQGA